MPSCLSALERVLNGLNAVDIPADDGDSALCGQLRNSSRLKGVNLIDHLLCNSIYFMQADGGIFSDRLDSVLKELHSNQFSYAPIQQQFSQTDESVIRGFGKGYFLPSGVRAAQVKGGESFEFGSYIERSIADFDGKNPDDARSIEVLRAIQDEIMFYDRLREEANLVHQDPTFMLDAFKKLVQIWVAKQDCMKYWNSRTCRYEGGFRHRNLFGSRIWDPEWWNDNDLRNSDPIAGESRFETILNAVCGAFSEKSNNDLVGDFRESTVYKWEEYTARVEGLNSSDDRVYVVPEKGQRERIRSASIEVLFKEFDKVDYPEALRFKSEVIFSVYVCSLIGVAQSDGRGTGSNFRPYKALSAERLCASASEEKRAHFNIHSIDLSAETVIPSIQVALPVGSGQICPVALVGRYHDRNKWLPLKSGLDKVVDRFFSTQWEVSALGLRLDARARSYICAQETDFSTEIAKRCAGDDPHPFYIDSEGVIADEPCEGFVVLTKENGPAEIELLEKGLKTALKAAFCGLQDKVEKEGFKHGGHDEAYFSLHPDGALVKSRTYKGDNPEATVGKYLEAACDSFYEKFGLNLVRSFTKRGLRSAFFEGGDSVCSEFFLCERSLLSKLENSDGLLADAVFVKAIEKSQLLYGLNAELKRFLDCNENFKHFLMNEATSSLAINSSNLQQFVLKGVKQWASAPGADKGLNPQRLKTCLHSAVDAFLDEEESLFLSLGSGDIKDNELPPISRQHLALYIDDTGDCPLTMSVFDDKNGALLTRYGSNIGNLLIGSADELKVSDVMGRYVEAGYCESCTWVQNNKIEIHRGDKILVAGANELSIQ